MCGQFKQTQRNRNAARWLVIFAQFVRKDIYAAIKTSITENEIISFSAEKARVEKHFMLPHYAETSQRIIRCYVPWTYNSHNKGEYITLTESTCV